MVVVGGIIGAGIFINPYLVAQRLSSGGLVLAAWVVGGAIALAGAFAFAELGALFPKAGGEYVYLREAYHPVVAFLFGWASLLMIQGGGLAAVAITFAAVHAAAGRRAARPAPRRSRSRRSRSSPAVNYVGVKPGSRLLNVLVVAEDRGAGCPDRRRACSSTHGRPPRPPAASAFPGGGRARRLRRGARFRSCSPTAAGRAPTSSPRRSASRAARCPSPSWPGRRSSILVYLLANVVYLARSAARGSPRRRLRPPTPCAASSGPGPTA